MHSREHAFSATCTDTVFTGTLAPQQQSVNPFFFITLDRYRKGGVFLKVCLEAQVQPGSHSLVGAHCTSFRYFRNDADFH